MTIGNRHEKLTRGLRRRELVVYRRKHEVIAGDSTPANPKLHVHAEVDVLAMDGVVEYCGQLVQAPLPLMAL